MRHHTASHRWLTLCAVALATGCAWSAEHIRPQGADPDPSQAYPQVSCDGTVCEIRIVLDVGDRTLCSHPLPFSAPSPESTPIDAGAELGLNPHGLRKLTAWAVGREEHSVIVALEPIAIDNDHGLIVHQIAGFDHPKRAHLVLEITDDELKTHLQRVEGTGPDAIRLWPIADGVVVSHQPNPAAAEQIEVYRWQGSAPARSLTPVE